MKRITKRNGGRVYFADDVCNLCAYEEQHKSLFCENPCCESVIDRTCPYLVVVDRLAEYEDTGLTPEEILNLKRFKKCLEGLKKL